MVVLSRGEIGPERVPGPGLHGQGSKKFLQIDMVLVWLWYGFRLLAPASALSP